MPAKGITSPLFVCLRMLVCFMMIGKIQFVSELVFLASSGARHDCGQQLEK